MRASYLSILALLPLSLAVPIHRSGQRDLGGLIGNIEQTFDNPALTGARLEVVKSLGDTSSALATVNTQAGSTSNAGVQSLVTQAQSGLAAAKGGVGKIGVALVTGSTPSKTDQATVAQGIHDAETAINGMSAAITTPDQTLSSNIASAVSSVGSLKNGGEAVLAASNLTLADLGLPASFAN